MVKNVPWGSRPTRLGQICIIYGGINCERILKNWTGKYVRYLVARLCIQHIWFCYWTFLIFLELLANLTTGASILIAKNWKSADIPDIAEWHSRIRYVMLLSKQNALNKYYLGDLTSWGKFCSC